MFSQNSHLHNGLDPFKKNKNKNKKKKKKEEEEEGEEAWIKRKVSCSLLEYF